MDPNIIPFIGIAPLLFYLWDAHIEGDIKRGFNQIIAFIITMAFAKIMINLYDIYFALSVPLFIIALVAFKKLQKNEK